MKNIILLAIMILSFFGCEQKSNSELEYEKLYQNNLRERYITLNKLGEWEYSPDKKDSIWNKTDATHNLNLIDKVFNELEPIEREWDSLIFLSKKHDTIPLPSDGALESYIRRQKRKKQILEWKFGLEKAVREGVYTRDGKKLIN